LDRLASEIQPTLIAVLSDINMPALDGLQLLGEIMQRFPDLPGHDCNCRRDDERGRKASELGAADGGSKLVRFGARNRRSGDRSMALGRLPRFKKGR